MVKCYTIKDKQTDELIEIFTEKGGKIHKHYLSTPIIRGPALVYLNGWFKGSNLRTAILRALSEN